jgi:hypothetical protein
VKKLVIVLAVLSLSGCTIHDVKKIEYDSVGKPTVALSYFSFGFFADMKKINAYLKSDANEVEAYLGESVTHYDPNVIKAGTEGIVGGVLLIK